MLSYRNISPYANYSSHYSFRKGDYIKTTYILDIKLQTSAKVKIKNIIHS